MSNEPTWDGITKAGVLREDVEAVRHEIADAGRDYKWLRLVALVGEHRECVNATRPGGTSLYAPLHQVAHGGAPVEVATRLIEWGAWRTLRNAERERPIDIALNHGHAHLLRLLEPKPCHSVDSRVLATIQGHFHSVVLGRVADLVREHALRPPELEPLLELEKPAMWFPVPGMYGGFHFWLEIGGEAEVKLVSESWCRVVGGSGERHEITATGSQLVDKGFV